MNRNEVLEAAHAEEERERDEENIKRVKCQLRRISEFGSSLGNAKKELDEMLEAAERGELARAPIDYSHR